jgi:tRNA pseudouridine38-40 synthase
MRLAMVVEYDGTEYSGWQIQPDKPTIQGALERALEIALGQTVRVESAGRTDAGVHARGQVVAFSTERTPDLGSLQRSLNALAGTGIGIRSLRAAPADFDPRRDARRRLYEYHIHNHPWPSPFCRRYSWQVRDPLTLGPMRDAAALLVGERDFRSFQAADCDAKSSIRRIFESTLVEAGDDLVYCVTATAFLRHMVRTIVGTLVEVGRGERSVEAFRDLIAARDRTRAGRTAPPHGLCLVRVEYDTDLP